MNAAPPEPPRLLVCPDATTLEAALAARSPAPLLLQSPPLAPAAREAALAAGVLAWLPLGAPPGAVDEALAWAAALAAQLQGRQGDRIWLDRAKGLLMQARGIDEPAAFALLRTTAMHTQARLPEVARGVVHTHELAEALERAGAQRMLSQRLVKLAALRQWPGLAPAEQREAATLQAACAERVAANLARLAELLRGELVAERGAVSSAWATLEAALAARPAELARCNTAAQGLLDASEALVAALAERAGPRPVRLLAQATRLRLLSQRLAKEGLLSQTLPGHDPTGLATGLDEFMHAYAQVRAAPLAGAALQPAFKAVDETWHGLLQGLRRQGKVPGDAVQRMHQASERLLLALEGLIQALQNSLQLILG